MPPTRYVDLDALRVRPGKKPKLGKIDTNDYMGLDRDDEEAIRAALDARIERQQSLMAAAESHSVLVVLQGMDASGKDGTTRAITRELNPMLVNAIGFGTPTKPELAHDYLWRIHPHTPARGEMAIFNRSHYEDDLVVRVDSLVPKKVWSARYDQINAFEQHLAENGTRILKFMLHISLDEQLGRLRDRVHNPLKRWKHNPGDYDNRAKWDDYMDAYADALAKTSTEHAPWYVIPADRKWARNIAIMQAIVDDMESLGLKEPPFPKEVAAELAEPPQ